MELDRFLRRYSSGLFIMQPGSRFAAALALQVPDRASLQGVDLTLEQLASVPGRLPEDPRLLAPGSTDGGSPGEVVVFTYRSTPCDAS